jgi:hypothetical protein
MRNLRDHVLTVFGFSVLVVGLLIAASPVSQAVPSDKDVRVINTTSEPVPTSAQGTTTIAGSVSVVNPITGSVSVTNPITGSVSITNPITGSVSVTNPITGSVSITNVPTVHINNTAASAVPVVNINDFQPFQTSVGATEIGTNVTTLPVTTVPAGKRLVIEFVSMSGQVPPGEHVELFQLNTIAGPVGGATHDFLVNPQPDAVIGDALFRTSEAVKIYANPGSQVSALIRRNSTAGTAFYAVTISGYLVDL